MNVYWLKQIIYLRVNTVFVRKINYFLKAPTSLWLVEHLIFQFLFFRGVRARACQPLIG